VSSADENELARGETSQTGLDRVRVADLRGVVFKAVGVDLMGTRDLLCFVFFDGGTEVLSFVRRMQLEPRNKDDIRGFYVGEDGSVLKYTFLHTKLQSATASSQYEFTCIPFEALVVIVCLGKRTAGNGLVLPNERKFSIQKVNDNNKHLRISQGGFL
jgi:hypothetical protein